jgi:toluene monooxygenase system ferredoxin subunit
MGWKKLCKTDEIGDRSLKEFDVDGVPVVVARVGDEFYAYPPLCPHQEERLAVSALCDGDMLTCTKHLWQWDVRTGEERGVAERPLLMYETRTEGDEVWVHVERELRYEYED